MLVKGKCLLVDVWVSKVYLVYIVRCKEVIVNNVCGI